MTCDRARGIGRIDWYRSRYFRAAMAYTSGSGSLGLVASSRLVGSLLSGVAPGKPARDISPFLGPFSGCFLTPASGGGTSEKRPSSEVSMSRMRSPSGVSRTARVKGPV